MVNFPLSHLQKLLQDCQYKQVQTLLDNILCASPSVRVAYWYLGLAYLLQGEEEAAQLTWMMGLDNAATEAQGAEWTQELIAVLTQEAEQHESRGALEQAWLIRQHIQALDPDFLENWLDSFRLSLQLQRLDTNDIEAQVWQSHLAAEPGSVDPDQLFRLLNTALECALLDPWIFSFLDSCVPHIPPLLLLNRVMEAAMTAANSAHRKSIAIEYVKFCLRVDPNQVDIWTQLAVFSSDLGDFNQALLAAQEVLKRSQTVLDFIQSSNLMLQVLLSSGRHWSEALTFAQAQQDYMQALETEGIVLDRRSTYRLLTCTYFLPYLQDAPARNRALHNKIMALCQHSIQPLSPPTIQAQPSTPTPQPILRIGYLSHCLREHSVGWLARWLYQYHDPTQCELYTYFVAYRHHISDPLQNWYEERSHRSHKLDLDVSEIRQCIEQDQVDILVDLDSLTVDINCEVLAYKPAPIQVSWLGWDASGLPAIDYYLVDSHAVPDHAQSYYHEKLWRLPHSYLCVNGFEVGTPTLSRQSLELPQEAVIYFSSQSGYKRNPDNIQLQFSILQQVPNSYFLIKDINKNPEYMRSFFEEMATAAGVSLDRLRFLPMFPSSETHRACLGLVDIVLDTYPYNGATTTLETLWMGVPLVTRVGQQFSARNSYTFMMNAGVTEGIAWTDEEYVEWGIRLGTDEQLRKEVAWKLRQSRKSAPLWNGQQFTRDMEAAYRQMWERYCHS